MVNNISTEGGGSTLHTRNAEHGNLEILGGVVQYGILVPSFFNGLKPPFV